VHQQDVDHAHDVVLAQALRLGEHLTAEVRLVEADDKYLYRTGTGAARMTISASG
jgi:hypothetical protein